MSIVRTACAFVAFLIACSATADIFGDRRTEWVFVVSSEDDDAPLPLSTEGAMIKRKERIGSDTLYVISATSPDVLRNAFEGSGAGYDALFENRRISMGPGNPAYAEGEVGNPRDSSRNVARSLKSNPFRKQKQQQQQQQRQRQRSRRNGKIGTDEGIDRNGGDGGDASNVEKRSVSCKKGSDSANRGYEIGFFAWGLDRIDQRDLPLDDAACFPDPSFSEDGGIDDAIDLYVVDTGVSDDPTFPIPVIYDYSYYDDGGKHSRDCNGHGTHVAGLAASEIYGSASRNVQVRSVKVLDCRGDGDFASMMAGLLWIKHHRNPNRRSIVNLSLGSRGGHSSAIAAVVEELWDSGTLVVASMGNNGESSCRVFPGNLESVIGVGSTNERDERASFSNHGRCVDVFAPGTYLVSCSNVPGKAGRVMSGTSMSAPLVSGALARWLSENDDRGSKDPKSARLLKDEFLNAMTYGRVKEYTIARGTPNVMLFSGDPDKSPSEFSEGYGAFRHRARSSGSSRAAPGAACWGLVAFVAIEIFIARR